MFLFPWIEIFKSTEGAGPQSPSCCTLIFLQWPRTDIFGHGPKKEAGVGQKREEKKDTAGRRSCITCKCV